MSKEWIKSNINNEIVEADIDGNDKLKRIMLMVSNAILIPENNYYESRILPTDEIRIIGVFVWYC